MIARLRIRQDESGQTLTLPPELTLPGSEVFVTKEGNRLVVEPVMVTDKSSFFKWLETIEPWDGPGPDDLDPPPEELKL
ncbi:AbrB/MazE/SpoVT family DNA-binding domain-containing protein [Pseudaminobacter sp. 19-2017]|uniref:AbrB/MazE/SpoVT family DNA-binding domain-containing protein n=1 Tax=Pseudaminobacter soli (ex Zhang et al. 2022) TaxID=2831468 RepID=A0A942E3Q7_9HYPH|nr:AbrB/MazE/SpoVT family DNA-binding domain-containing protein [Pseudaminobacter soli]MBS3650411.1 AbrB/MazE/SpoVT family DNA-binding domain-containing protein [Pseudaminobacter soli]